MISNLLFLTALSFTVQIHHSIFQQRSSSFRSDSIRIVAKSRKRTIPIYLQNQRRILLLYTLFNVNSWLILSSQLFSLHNQHNLRILSWKLALISFMNLHPFQLYIPHNIYLLVMFAFSLKSFGGFHFQQASLL